VFDLRDATVSYDGNVVLDGISLRIGLGERVALVGRSGVGKSTLLNLLFEQRRETAALVPQDPGLVRSLSVFHNVFMGRLSLNSVGYNLLNLVWPRKSEVDAVRDVLVSLELEEKLFEPAGELSGGQQQRTSVARALFRDGDALLADEPVSSVDEHQSRSVLASINAVYETTVLAMHDVDLALAYCTRIVGLDGGKIVLDAPADRMTRADLMPLYKGETPGA